MPAKTAFASLSLADAPLVTAPDGSDVRPLLSLSGGSLAHFELAAGKASIAVAHRTIEEIWFVIGGAGEMWREQDQRQETVTLAAGMSLTIPVGTAFQFRSFGPEPLRAIAITMPPWPGEDEAYKVPGKWPATAAIEAVGTSHPKHGAPRSTSAEDRPDRSATGKHTR